MNLNLTDHVVAVTGGASGIGRAIAAGFFAENSRVAIWDSAAMVEQTAAQLAA